MALHSAPITQIPSPAMRILLFSLLVACKTLLCAQDDPRVFVPYQQGTAGANTTATDSGEVIIHEPAAVSELMKHYASSKQPLKGYRVQIFLGDRNKAEEIRRSFLIKHPKTPAYLSYLAPNFRVRVGDERTKLDGERLRRELRDEFPGLYVVPDEIELPRLPEF